MGDPVDGSRGTPCKDPSKDDERGQIRDAFAKLPEKPSRRCWTRSDAAMVIDKPEEATRLLDKRRQEYPGDYDVARMAVRVYRSTGEIDAAKAAVAQALKANPNDRSCRSSAARSRTSRPRTCQKIQEEELLKNPDEFLRALGPGEPRAAARASPRSRSSTCWRRRSVKPESPELTAMLFNHYLWQKQWDKAEGDARAARPRQPGPGGRAAVPLPAGDGEGGVPDGAELRPRS